MPRRRECFCPSAILRCAHVDGDVVQAWRSAGGSYVIEGPNGPGTLGLPVYTYTRADFEIEWQHRVGCCARSLRLRPWARLPSDSDMRDASANGSSAT